MKKNAFLLICLILFAACAKKEAAPKIENDFETLMGKGFPAWEYVQTKEDFENLSYFKTVFDNNIPLISSSAKKIKIPKILHYIWLGPKDFPRESVQNVKVWIAKNPDWVVKFWTDRDRPLPCPTMQKVLLKDFNFFKLGECFNKSDNYGEKSDILRYEILYQQGGVYVDHDVKCMQSFDAVNCAFDLYCGMEMPYKTSLTSCCLPTNNVVGARAYHPVIKYSLDWMKENWDAIEKDYPGKDKDAVINRVSHRSFSALGIAFKKVGNTEGNRDIAFPTFYFNAPTDNLAILSRHLYEGTWFENETKFEKMARERLMYLSKKTNKILLFVGVMSSLNLIGFAVLFILFRRYGKHRVE